MATTASTGNAAPALLSRERTIAKPGFNRWLVPPAALAIHLCIGMSYGLSVFWLPLAQAIGIEKPVTCPDMTMLDALFTTTCDWRVTDLLVIFTLGIVFLGLSAAVFGGWLERAGPRKAGVAAALCWGGGFIISSFGVMIHQLWVLWIGLGVIGGIGLGLGYISPVSTLIKWFPDRRGMATGMAIMGFGGGAMIGSPLAVLLMNGGDLASFGNWSLHLDGFRTATSVGVWQTFLTLGLIYLVFMLAGAFGYRVPPDGWAPEGWTPKATNKKMITSGNVDLAHAHRTPQFWLIWMVLCMNVSAGIGVLAMASPMLQEIFAGSLIGQPEIPFSALNEAQKIAIAAIAGGFVSLLSLFNSGGRFAWASASDFIGRKRTYFIFFALGMLLYGLAPTLAHMGSRALFVAAFCVILSMYGGGFATVPAYLADIFGTKYVGAIHGRLLTAWSTAGVVGPMVIGYIRDAQIAAGIPRALVYDRTMYILVGFLLVGLICNALVRPVHSRWLMSDPAADAGPSKVTPTGSFGIGLGGVSVGALLAWLAVGIPFAWGVWSTIVKAVALFS
ncbi:OFA family MFS transporter [Hyphomicrobium sp. NDB2Meth4]|uniref:OFA family MFS transporter n=1 Tax=Hyphomicrobium sp. NDB2Meth4 TaxID=1892846 RepID=UPI000930DC0F|nr:OFA family MFS transporter [Hyphomicrobium sp. NDB2Meth4]